MSNALRYNVFVDVVQKNPFRSGPYSAVRPETVPAESPEEPARVSEPSDAFEDSASWRMPGSSDIGTESLGSQHSIAQVVHLLVDSETDFAEELSEEIGLPVLSLGETSLDELESELTKERYADGLILEGIPRDFEEARELDSLFRQVTPENHRVLGTSLVDESFQGVVDHYTNLDLLWIVPDVESDEKSDSKTLQDMLLCLQGMPVLE